MRKFKHIKTGLIATESEFHYNLENNCGDVKEIPKCIVEDCQDWKIFYVCEVGTKIKDNTYGNIITKTEGGWSYPWENDPDFVERGIGSRFSLIGDEEVKEDAFQILSFKRVLGKDPLYTFNESTGLYREGLTLDCLRNSVKNGSFIIHSIRRNSDGEIFTVGDRCHPKESPSNRDKIREFRLVQHGSGLYVCSVNKAWGQDLNNIQKVRTENYRITTLHWVTDQDNLIKYNEPTQAWRKGFKEDFNSNITEEEFIESYLESGLWKIHTIICEDKTFSVGDKVVWDWSRNNVKYFTIKSFQESAKYGIEFSPKEHDCESWFDIIGLLKRLDLRHYKESLFTTYDQVEIFEGDEYFYVIGGEMQGHSWRVNCHICNWSNTDEIPLGYWQFAEKKNAEAYILRNKPCLSVEEVLDALESEGVPEWGWDRTCKERVNKLEGLVQKKIGSDYVFAENLKIR